jgi:hypothetical protein
VIPVKDTVRARGFPFVSAGLIASNLVVFLLERRLPPPLRRPARPDYADESYPW